MWEVGDWGLKYEGDGSGTPGPPTLQAGLKIQISRFSLRHQKARRGVNGEMHSMASSVISYTLCGPATTIKVERDFGTKFAAIQVVLQCRKTFLAMHTSLSQQQPSIITSHIYV